MDRIVALEFRDLSSNPKHIVQKQKQFDRAFIVEKRGKIQLFKLPFCIVGCGLFVNDVTQGRVSGVNTFVTIFIKAQVKEAI